MMSTVSYVNGNWTDNLIVIKPFWISRGSVPGLLSVMLTDTVGKQIKSTKNMAVSCPANSGGGLSPRWPVLLPSFWREKRREWIPVGSLSF